MGGGVGGMFGLIACVSIERGCRSDKRWYCEDALPTLCLISTANLSSGDFRNSSNV